MAVRLGTSRAQARRSNVALTWLSSAPRFALRSEQRADVAALMLVESMVMSTARRLIRGASTVAPEIARRRGHPSPRPSETKIVVDWRTDILQALAQ